MPKGLCYFERVHGTLLQFSFFLGLCSWKLSLFVHITFMLHFFYGPYFTYITNRTHLAGTPIQKEGSNPDLFL